MPDITMCNRDDCPVSKTCRRHADSGTVPDTYQSYGEFTPDNCEWYWPMDMKSDRCDIAAMFDRGDE